MKTFLSTMTALLLITGSFLVGCTDKAGLTLTKQRSVRLDAIENYNRGDYETAVGTFHAAVKQEPRDFRSQYYLGLTYEKLNNYEQALQSYKAAMKIMRSTLAGRDAVDFRQMVMNSLASLIARHDQERLEERLLDDQIKSGKLSAEERAENYFLLAKIQRYRRDADSALLSYTNAANLDANDFWLQKEAGLYLAKFGKKFTATKILRRAVQLNSRDPEILTAMQQLNLETPRQLTKGDEYITVFKTMPMPNVELRMTDTPVAPPDQLPMD